MLAKKMATVIEGVITTQWIISRNGLLSVFEDEVERKEENMGEEADMRLYKVEQFTLEK
jgi:hypothetical protein